jgi:atlastin
LLLSPERLVPKEVNGERITVKDLVGYWKTYMDVFNTGDLPKPQSIFEVRQTKQA